MAVIFLQNSYQNMSPLKERRSFSSYFDSVVVKLLVVLLYCVFELAKMFIRRSTFSRAWGQRLYIFHGFRHGCHALRLWFTSRKIEYSTRSSSSLSIVEWYHSAEQTHREDDIKILL